MDEILTRFMESLVGRVHGPMSVRMLLQPLMAIVFAARDGLRDSREGKPPYFWALATDPGHRRDMLRNGWMSVGKVFLLALALEAAYQLLVAKWFYPIEALLVAGLLALVPYLLLRGPINRLFNGKTGRC